MLHDLQREFSHHVTVLASDTETGIARRVKPGIAGISGGRRLNVYHNNIAVSLRQALAAIYPLVEQLVGEEFFAHTARCYLRKYPSKSGNLHELGCHLPGFLDDFEAAGQLPYLPAVARMEWAWHQVFHARDADAIDRQALASIDDLAQQRLIFQISPALQLLQVDAPVLEIRQFALTQEIEPAVPEIDDAIRYLLIYRKELDITMQYLSVASWKLLQCCQRGFTLVAAMETVLAENPDFVLEQWLPLWFDETVVCGFTLKAPDTGSIN